MRGKSPEAQLETFLARYAPPVAALGRESIAALSCRLPGAVRQVYDNYNALVVGFGPSEKASESLLSIALYPRWVNLFFLHGATLDDPAGLLQGEGKQVRSIRLASARDVDRPEIARLIAQALAQAGVSLDAGEGRTVVKSVTAKQRPRRPRS